MLNVSKAVNVSHPVYFWNAGLRMSNQPVQALNQSQEQVYMRPLLGLNEERDAVHMADTSNQPAASWIH